MIHQFPTPAAKQQPVRHQLSEAEAAALVHDSYLAQIRSNLCTHCGCGERWIELYEVWVHPTSTRHTKLAVKRPTTKLLQGFDLVYFEVGQTNVPVCSECIVNYKVDEKAAAPAASREAWALTLARKYAPEPKQSGGRPEPSLDSL